MSRDDSLFRLRRRLAWGSWFQRATLAVAVGINVVNLLVIQDRGSRGWWLALAWLLVLLAVQSWMEGVHQRNRRFRREALERRWALAASSSDPIGALAQWDYMERLSSREMRELVDWLEGLRQAHQGDRPYDPAEWEEVPPVVAGWLLARVRTPRDPHGGS